MLTELRHSYIRKELASNGQILAGDLAVRFGVSEDTARRDLRELAKLGDCRRVYGGAVAPAPDAAPIALRKLTMSDEKLRLAAAAVQLLSTGQSVFIDGGSTNIAIAKAIPSNLKLTVATNALDVAVELAKHSGIQLVMFGGVFDRESGTTFGGDTLRAVAQFNADLFILGSCGVHAVQGVTAFDAAEAEVKRAMAHNSSGILVVATADKLATAAPHHVARSSSIRHLVVDRIAPLQLRSEFEDAGIQLHLA